MKKRLVINADDFGLAEDINKGIIECYTSGAVSDITLLAVGDSFGHAVKLARENNIDKIGAHLALTGSFKPLTPAKDISSLVGRNAKFPKSYTPFLVRYFAGLIKSDEIYTEFKNQISRVKKEGFGITHLDSHQHIHAVPGILKIVIKLMKEESISYVRFPLERVDTFLKTADTRAWLRSLLLAPMCWLSRGLLDTSGVKYNDYFAGHARALRLRKKDLILAISSLKNGLTELGCHPGYFTEDVKRKYPYYRNCEEELKALCDRGFVDGIKTRSIELGSY